MNNHKIFKLTFMNVLVPVVISMSTGLIILVYQGVNNFKNTLFFLSQEIKQAQESLAVFSLKEDIEIPLSENQLPNKYWETLDGEELNNIYNCDNQRSIEVYYKSLDILKANYVLAFNLATGNQNPTASLGRAINNQEKDVLGLSEIALGSIRGCNRPFVRLFLHEFRGIFSSERVSI